MEIIFLKVLPLIVIFLLGYLLKRTGILKKDDGDILVKLIFFLAAPALEFISLQKIQLDHRFFFVPII